MKHYLSAAVLALAFTACGDDYDDTALWEQVNDNTNRIEALETWQEQVNNNIAALQQLLNTTDYITSVTPVTEDGKEVGYTISFRNSDPITIYHGEKGDKGDKGDQGEQGEQGIPGEPGKDGADGSDGSDGSTPQVGLQQGDDGNWYWTLNGSLMKDPNGDPIPANGEDGKDGDDGDDGNNAPTPQILLGNNLPSGGKVMTDSGTTQADAWYLSVDNGATWYRISGDKGDQGNDGTNGDDGVLKVETAEDGNSVTITFDDNSSIVLPTWQWAESIEEDIAELNGQLEAYAGLMQGKLLITGVEATKDGQTITYITVDKDGKPSNPQSFTITNGKDGEKGDDGATPTIEIKEGYWYINGEPTNVPATGENGKTPEFTLDAEGNLSYQFEGEASVSLGNIKGPQGNKGEQGNQGNPGKDGVFTGITYTPGDATAVLTLADGTTIEVAIYQPLTIGEGTGTLTVPANGTYNITLTIPDNVTALMAQITPEGSGGTFTDLDTRAVSGWSVEAKLDEQKVTVTAPASGKALLDVSLIRADGSKVTASRVLEAINLVTAEMTEITAAGNYLLTGERTTGITINAENVTLTLENASLNTSGIGINVTKSATIKVSGKNNNITSSGSSGIYVAPNNTITITGSSWNDELTVKGGNARPGIGGYVDGYSGVNCGDITISNITVSANGSGDGQGNASPGIGCVGNATCGTITISNATIYASGFNDNNYISPGIGCGFTLTEYPESIPDVVASNSEIHAHRGNPGYTCDYIGWGAYRDPSATYANSAITPGAGSIKSCTVYCYTGETLDKTVVYDASGNSLENY